MRRILALDYSRGLAIIGVVILHNALRFPDVKQAQNVLIDSFIKNLADYCVPVFLFLAGYFMAHKHEKTFGEFFRNKLKRVWVPTLFWILFFFVTFSILDNKYDYTPTFFLLFFLFNIVLLYFSTQYYFTFVLIILFAAFYFIIDVDNKKIIQMLWICFILNLLTIIIYEYLLWTINSNQFFTIAVYRFPLAWVFFFMYGIYTFRIDPEMKMGLFKYIEDHKIRVLAVALVLWILTSLETFILTPRELPTGDYYKVASFLLECILIPFIIVMVRHIKPETTIARGLLVLSKYSFFIYLIHIPLVPKLFDYILGAGWFGNYENNLYYPNLFLRIILELTIPIAIAWLISSLAKLPHMNKVALYVGLRA